MDLNQTNEKKDSESKLSDLENNQKPENESDEYPMSDIKKLGASGTQPQRFHRNTYKSPESDSKPGSKKLTVAIFLILVATITGAGFSFRHRINQLLKGNPSPQPTQTPAPTSEPKPTPPPLVRSDWSFEILNGSGVSGQAKKLADKIKNLGYPVVKSANADKQTYDKTEIFVKKELQDKINALIVDLKDIIKIASIEGELKEGTASARIIIGKDLSL